MASSHSEVKRTQEVTGDFCMIITCIKAFTDLIESAECVVMKIITPSKYTKCSTKVGMNILLSGRLQFNQGSKEDRPPHSLQLEMIGNPDLKRSNRLLRSKISMPLDASHLPCS